MSCPNCREGTILPGEPTGSIQPNFHGAYYAPSPSTSEGDPKRAIIYLTDGFGLPLKNCKIMADNLAKRLNCDVWIPDYFAGKPLIGVNQLVLPDRAGVKLTLWDWVKFVVAIAPNIPAVIANRPSVVDKRVHELLKEKKKYEKIGAVGYCYGGSTSIRLGSTGLVDSVVICHPGSFSLDEVRAITVPAAWMCAEDDLFFSTQHRLNTEAIFAEKKNKDSSVEYAFHHFKGTTHGFAARPNLAIPEIKEAHENAFEETVAWFEKTL